MTATRTVHPAVAGEADWQRAACEYIDRLRERYRDRLAAVVLYGSRARGDADEYSDVDLLVVLRGEFDQGEEHQAALALARELDERYGDCLVCPVVATEHDYHRRMLPLFMNIRREGIELWAARGGRAVREETEPYGEPPREELRFVRLRMTEALEDAEAGLQHGRYDWAANRAYYAMFHAATALLLSEGLAYSRHRGVIGAFRRRFVKPGRFPQELGAGLSAAFDLRNKADYSYREQVAPEEVADTVLRAQQFVTEAERLLG